MSTSAPTDINGDASGSGSSIDYSNFNLTAAQGNDDLTRIVTCFLQAATNDYNGNLGARISSVFVIFVVSTIVTFFPVLAARVKKLRIPIYVYLFARYFGSGVIVATGFIHLLDPAYYEIGNDTCVGMTGGWAEYSWPPALALASCLGTFLLDFVAERYVEKKYGTSHEMVDVEHLMTGDASGGDGNLARPHVHDEENGHDHGASSSAAAAARHKEKQLSTDVSSEIDSITEVHAFHQQIAAFLVLEFGVIFHSVIIGLALGTAGSEFSTLYVVIIFHQSFEGMGIGARMSAIPFPPRWHWLPWALCLAYGLTTPIAISIGLGLRTTYNSGSYTANVISGVLDSLSAGILIYTGLVELLARDFLFDPKRTKDGKRLAFMTGCVFLGAGLMALLGKWA